MNGIFILLLMVFMHIVDDYYLQGILASMKQKSYWSKPFSPLNRRLYRYDYLWALLMHGFSWTFMIMLPIAFVYSFEANIAFLIAFVINWIIHSMVDDLKANKEKINLWLDQIIHLGQIFITAIILL